MRKFLQVAVVRAALTISVGAALVVAVAAQTPGFFSYTDQGLLFLRSTQPYAEFIETDAGADGGVWRVRVNAGIMVIETVNDARSATVAGIAINRGAGTAISSIVVPALNASGVSSGSFTDMYRAGAWASLGWANAANTRLAVGGFRGSEWIAVDLYANGNSAGTFTDSTTTLPGAMVHSGVISPSTLCTGTPCTVDNWNPTGLASARTLRTLCDLGIGDTCTVTSIVGGVAGRELVLVHIGAVGTILDIEDEAGTGTAANKILTGTGGTVSLSVNQAVTLQYDKDVDRWRIVSKNF
jgi:hypothetical protein